MTDPASLQNLHPIVPPPAAELWPLAPGWYLLLLTAFLFTAKLLFDYLQKRNANSYRRTALRQLEIISAEIHGGSSDALRKLPRLVKGVALHAYPRAEVAGLHGRPWLELLDATLGSREFSDGPGRLLPDLAYQPPEMLANIDKERIDELTTLITQWIQDHHPLPADKEVGHA